MGSSTAMEASLQEKDKEIKAVNAGIEAIQALPEGSQDGARLNKLYDLLIELQKQKTIMMQQQAAATTSGATGTLAGDVSAEKAVMRAHVASKYVGHDEFYSSVTVIAPSWLVTYAHGEHAKWAVDDTVQVWINDETGDTRTPMQATVRHKSDAAKVPKYDFVLLKVKGDWGKRATPMLDMEVYRFAPYVLVGASARSQADPHSTRHGSMLSTCMDVNCHMRGDTPSAVGDSGGGCFLMSTGTLFAINVGQEGQSSCLLHMCLPWAKIRELEAEEQQLTPQ